MEVPANAFIWCLAQKNLQDEQKLKDHPKNLKVFWDVQILSLVSILSDLPHVSALVPTRVAVCLCSCDLVLVPHRVLRVSCRCGDAPCL